MIVDESTIWLIWFFLYLMTASALYFLTHKAKRARDQGQAGDRFLPTTIRGIRIDVHTMLKPSLLTSKYFFPLHFFSSDESVLAMTVLNIFILEEVCTCPHAFIKPDFSEVLASETETWIFSLITSTKEANLQHLSAQEPTLWALDGFGSLHCRWLPQRQPVYHQGRNLEPSLMIDERYVISHDFCTLSLISVRVCCMSILLPMPTSPKAKHLSPITPAVE